MLRLPEEVNILYIEDDEDQVNLMEEMLSKTGLTKFNIVHRGSLKECVTYMGTECTESESCNVDIILLDLVLPNSSGVDTFKQVHEMCDFLPIVIISTFVEMACECVKLGAQDYLIKEDLTKTLLIRSLKYALERKKLIEDKIESQTNYRDLVEVTRAIIYEIDFRTMKFVYVNEQMCKLTGWTKEEFLELSPSDVLTDRSISEFSERMEQLKKGKHIAKTHEFEVKLKDGSFGWTLITAKYKEDEEGNVVGANVVAIDITDKKIAEKKAKQAEEAIFDELETRVQQWKTEITTERQIQQTKLQAIDMDIMAMTKRGYLT